ncbi:DNA damage-responsive repressor gis1/rph1, jumonji superfamily, partial [Globisporangium splendens]
MSPSVDDVRDDVSHATAATSNSPWCPEFRPTADEFASFATYMRTVVEPQCAHIGLCKIIPPMGWFSRSYALKDLASDCTVTRPVSQHVAGKKGIFNVDLVERKTMDVREFKTLADAYGKEKDEPDTETETSSDLDDIERRFWKSLRPTMDAPVYGADIVGSLFGDNDALSWNVNKLDTILRRIDLPGVTRAMLYFGMWRAMFAFHTEDMDLYSINYLHTGKPKFWYAVPPQSASQLERAAQAMFPEKHHACNQAYQKPGEFVITFPATYHEGFNLGFNIAEAVNFASLRWIPFGLKAKLGVDDASSEDPEYEVDEQWFECSQCKIWTHLGCVHQDLVHLKDDELPQDILCHRCSPQDITTAAGGSHRKVGARKSRSQTPQKRTRSGTRSPRTGLGKRGAAAGSESDATTSQGSPTKSIDTTPTKRRTIRKQLFVKGSTIYLQDTEVGLVMICLDLCGGALLPTDHAWVRQAKVAAVEGNFIRVHYKVQGRNC